MFQRCGSDCNDENREGGTPLQQVTQADAQLLENHACRQENNLFSMNLPPESEWAKRKAKTRAAGKNVHRVAKNLASDEQWELPISGKVKVFGLWTCKS